MIRTIFSLVIWMFTLTIVAQSYEKNLAPKTLDVNYKASPRPDRIILTWSKNDLSTQTVTWRTDTTVTDIEAEIAKVTPDVDFYKNETDYDATSTTFTAIDETVQYHTTTFKNLEPDTYYAYRLKADDYSSEWVQFKTAPKTTDKPFSFIYLGDAQNDLFSLWSRVIRLAYKRAPDAKFMLHAGDMINHSQNNYEWGEWFEAGSFIFKEMPQLTIPGNHEYIKNDEGHKTGITPIYNPQFNFPKNGLAEIGHTNYYMDYLNMRLISLNSNQDLDLQKTWLEDVLKNNTKKWVVVMTHHPVRSPAKGRFNKGVIENWKPLFEKYKVDLVLQGHDHTYGRGNKVNLGYDEKNDYSGTMYVVSVSGRKMYELGNEPWMEAKAENQQSYQIITIDDSILTYKAYTTDDTLFDGFTLTKRKNKDNKVKEIK
ncbi:purple acid phosphatase family protein [Aureibaculum marinum]|nr:metallophosphoesterase family protein [Aureibaculum marinum]